MGLHLKAALRNEWYLVEEDISKRKLKQIPRKVRPSLLLLRHRRLLLPFLLRGTSDAKKNVLVCDSYREPIRCLGGVDAGLKSGANKQQEQKKKRKKSGGHASRGRGASD